MASGPVDEERGSSTNPFSTGVFEARLANEAQGPPPESDAPGETALSVLSLPVAVHDLSLEHVPDKSARIVVSSLSPSSAADNSPSPLVPFRLGQTPGELLAVQQSSSEAWFSVDFGSAKCTFYYDPGSDNVVFRNASRVALQLAPIREDNETDDSERGILKHRQTRFISPGPWRLFLDSMAPEVVADFLLFRRRYVMGMAEDPKPAAGVKRKGMLPDEGSSKRTRQEIPGQHESLILISRSKQGQSSGAQDIQLDIVKSGNPLISLEPGQTVTIRPESSLGPAAERESESQGTQGYSLLHLRDIASSKGLASVFSARHSVFGDTAVKVIRTRRVPQHAYIPMMAQNWKTEEQLLRSVDHESIIRFFGSDARLYSIYMEYLPFPDLNAWRNRPHDHYFRGTIEDADRILRDMASALAYLEAKKIQHNDIKPGNILYDRGRGAVLIDFGLAAPHDNGILCTGGTPWYVPRELMASSRGPKSDVYALGVSMLYLLKKIPLPDVSHPAWIIAKVLEGSEDRAVMEGWLSKVEAARAEIGSSRIEVVVRGMLEPDPESRKTAHEAEEELNSHS